MLAYTFAHAIDDGQDALVAGRPATVQDSYAPNSEKGPSVTDQRQRFVFSFVLAPKPFHRDHEWLGIFFNNWKASSVFTYGSGRPVSATVTGDANQDGNNSNDRLPGVSRNSLLGPDYATTDMRLTRRLYAGDRVKLELMAESFNLLNRDNRRVQITQDGFQSNSAQFVQTDKTIGINIFPAQYRVPSSFPAGHRRLRSAADPARVEADLLGINGSDRWKLAAFSLHENAIYHLTCRGNLAITIPVQTGPVWGCSSVGRSKTSRGRVPRKRIASLQAQGATGRHH